MENTMRLMGAGSMTQGYKPVRLSSLCADTVAGFDLYILSRPDQPPVLYRAKDLPFGEANKLHLKALGMSILYIKTNEAEQYRSYVENNLSAILRDSGIPIQERAEVLYGSAMGAVKDILNDPRAGDVLPRSQQLVENSIEFLFREPKSFQNILKVTSCDYYTFTHSVNVFVFSVALARVMGYNDEVILRFGCGTLLHDVGKSMIDPAILNYPGRLSPEQFEQIKLHPIHGFNLLRDQGLSEGTELDIVRHHHEKLTGRGYPDGLKDGELSPLVRISTAADIFDALTTKRCYKEAMKTFDALALMKREMAEELDDDVFRRLVAMMSKRGAI